MAKLKKIKKSTEANKPKGFDLQAVSQSFNSLDPQNMGTWPLVVKLTIAAFIAGLILLLAYLVPIKNKINDIKTAEKEEASLLDTYREKESKARNLQAYKQQIIQMESTFDQLLDQLPKKTKIPALVEDINMDGVESGVRFKDISVRPEITQELFIEQPISILSKGDYHEFGNFVSGMANRSRIITMHDFTISNTSNDILNELPKLELQLNANTYRSREASEEKGKTEGDKK